MFRLDPGHRSPAWTRSGSRAVRPRGRCRARGPTRARRATPDGVCRRLPPGREPRSGRPRATCSSSSSTREHGAEEPHGRVEAFTRAFAPGEGPVLVSKSVNGRDESPASSPSSKPLPGTGRTSSSWTGYVSEAERELVPSSRACDCYVSLHRSEGFGLTIAEAMAFGKPVIATATPGMWSSWTRGPRTSFPIG